jgi:hypothetical protein
MYLTRLEPACDILNTKASAAEFGKLSALLFQFDVYCLHLDSVKFVSHATSMQPTLNTLYPAYNMERKC